MSGTPRTVSQRHNTKNRNSSKTTLATSNLTSFMLLFICGLFNVSTSGCIVSKDDRISKQWMWKDMEQKHGRRRRKKNKLSLFLKEKYLEEYMVRNMKMGNGKVGRIENYKSW